MHYILNSSLIEKSENVQISECKLKKLHEINWNEVDGPEKKKYVWGSVVQDNNNTYLFMRLDTINSDYYKRIYPRKNWEEEEIHRYRVSYEGDEFKLIYDKDFELDLYGCNHNFCIHKIKKNNKNEFYLSGGQIITLEKDGRLREVWKKKFKNYFENDIKIETLKISDTIRESPTEDHFSPYYGNGHYFFKISDVNTCRQFEVMPLTLEKPTIGKYLGGNRDSPYDEKAFSYNFRKKTNEDYPAFAKELISNWNGKLLGGFPAFDSLNSLLFNEKENKYYYYTRANIISGLRNIQYTTSTDLINWSSWNMIKFSKNQDEIYSKANYYLNNFTKIDGLNGYFGILQYFNAKISKKSKFKVGDVGKFQLLYSKDCVTWDVFNNIFSDKLMSIEYQTSIHGYIQTPDKFITLQNHRTLIDNIDDDRLSFFSFDKNRFIYVSCIEKNDIGNILTKPIEIDDLTNIYINFETYENGFIQIRLLDESRNVIEPYTFTNFIEIGENLNNNNYRISWYEKPSTLDYNQNSWINRIINSITSKLFNNSINYESEEKFAIYEKCNKKVLDNLETNKKFHIEIKGMNFKLYSIAW